MRSFAGRLSGLYAITDEKLIPQQGFAEAVEQALAGGARIIQYRDKSLDHAKRLHQAGELCRLCRKYRATAIVNDDIELALLVNADGVHLGKDDARLAEARQKLGQQAIIGISCYNDYSLAVEAKKNGADYIAFGAMFSSPTKPLAVNASPGLIQKARQQLDLPVCTIGGIDTANARQLIEYGADMIAVISALFASTDIRQTAEQFTSYFKQSDLDPAA
jgi:thiamine-phosphate pyrophosphorylase